MAYTILLLFEKLLRYVKTSIFSAFTIVIVAEITNNNIFLHFPFTFSPPHANLKTKFVWPYYAEEERFTQEEINIPSVRYVNKRIKEK